MKPKFLTTSLLALALCSTGALAHAEDNGPGGWGGHRGHFGYMSRELNLTPAQKEQIHTLMQAQRTANRPIFQQMQQNRAAILTATAGGAFNQATIQSLATKQAQLEVQLTVQRTELESKIYNSVLTTEQKATADQMRQKQLARIQQRLQAPATPETPTPAATE
jgi:Spy/CpxP family protein refolding chaperone